MNDEGFEEWDPDFLDQLIQVEEMALFSSNLTQNHHRNQNHNLQPPHPPPPLYPAPPHSSAPFNRVSYSPPCELSQRVKEIPTTTFDPFSNPIAHSLSSISAVPNARAAPKAKEREIDSLKKELGKVSKQLTNLEQECLDLRKERDKKEEQLKSALSRLEAKDAKVHCKRSTELHDGGEYEVHNQDRLTAPRGCQSTNFSHQQAGCPINVGTPACKDIGVQTDKVVDTSYLVIKNDLSAPYQPSRKLLRIWDSTLDQLAGRNLVSKLFAACETDFCVLFGYLSSNPSSKTTLDTLGNEYFSDISLDRSTQHSCSAEAAKVSHLYSTLTKISNGFVKLEELLKALVDLCCLENVVIVGRSLRILRVVLNHILSMERKFEKRDNLKVEGPVSGYNSSEIQGSSFLESRSLFDWNTDETSYPAMKLFNPEPVSKKRVLDHSSTLSTAGVDWDSLFELMQQITVKSREELVRLEAVSIMNIILMRSNAYLERETYGQGRVFQTVSRILRKEAGLCVQKQAVHLIYLLLNCPKIMSMFCSGYKEDGISTGAAFRGTTKASTLQQCSGVLEGLADCVACRGDGTQVLQLHRNVIILLAFFASSGKSGVEILLSHELSRKTNFFALILEMLVAEMDLEAPDSVQPPEIFKERTLLIREALIFLNRLVSNPQYSAPVLRILTNSRDVAFLTIDIGNRLSRKNKWLWQSDNMTRKIRESEIVDLAQIFKRKVFNFLGENISSKQNQTANS